MKNTRQILEVREVDDDGWEEANWFTKTHDLEWLRKGNGRSMTKSRRLLDVCVVGRETRPVLLEPKSHSATFYGWAEVSGKSVERAELPEVRTSCFSLRFGPSQKGAEMNLQSRVQQSQVRAATLQSGTFGGMKIRSHNFKSDNMSICCDEPVPFFEAATQHGVQASEK